MPDQPDTAALLTQARRVHLVGVAGSAMRSFATLLLDLGREVSGSDTAPAPMLGDLTQRGLHLFGDHQGTHVDGADLVIVSAAIPGDNPEIVAAHARGVPILTHAQALGALMREYDGIGVAGTHGKSTTTALVAHLLALAGRDPTLAGGADALDFGGSARLGHGPELVAEADEFARRFHELHPRIAIITGIEPDHLDYYGTFDAIVESFRHFVDGLPDDAILITCEEEPNLAGLSLPRRRIRYGWAGHADWRLERYAPRQGGGAGLIVRSSRGERRSYESRLSGRHNAANAVAALAVADLLGVDGETAARGLASFQGTRRRFETVAREHGVWLVDDYAHHPTAVVANLAAARDVHDGRLVVVFQPHTTHRTAALMDAFATAFDAADRVILTPIYQPTGREATPGTVTSRDLHARMAHRCADVVSTLDEAAAAAREELRPGTLVLTMGAGDISSVARRLAKALAPTPPRPGSKRPTSNSCPPTSALAQLSVELERDVPLGRQTSLRVGGTADQFIASNDVAALARVLEAAAEDGLDILMLGGGSNLLVADEGVRGLVIKYTGGGYGIGIGGHGTPILRATAGTTLSSLARRLAREGLGGLEWAATVPGTIGGAVVNNAGAFGGCIADHIVDAEILVPRRGAVTLTADELGYAYRTSTLKRGEHGPVIVTSARLRLHHTDAAAATARIADFQARRTATQPRQLSAGSIFANPPGDFAGRLIEAVGLKGTRQGGAQISDQHANFIVNPGGATAHDVFALIRRAQDAVWTSGGIWLQPEVQLVGRWSVDERSALTGPLEAALR
jgi:UDP-N-acetylmuramate--alanine ligase